MSRVSLFPRVGEVNAWIEATGTATGTSTPKGHCGRLPTWCARSWAKSTRKHVPASHSNRSTCGCSRNATGWRPSRAAWTQERRKLDEVDEAKLCRTLDRNAFTTNRDLAAVVGNKISERSVSVYLARAKPRFTANVVQDQEPEELSEEWKTEAKQWLEEMKPRSIQRKAAPAGANPYFAQGRGM